MNLKIGTVKGISISKKMYRLISTDLVKKLVKELGYLEKLKIRWLMLHGTYSILVDIREPLKQ